MMICVTVVCKNKQTVSFLSEEALGNFNASKGLNQNFHFDKAP